MTVQPVRRFALRKLYRVIADLLAQGWKLFPPVSDYRCSDSFSCTPSLHGVALLAAGRRYDQVATETSAGLKRARIREKRQTARSTKIQITDSNSQEEGTGKMESWKNLRGAGQESRRR
jgi:hypothetical protein